MQQWLNFWKVKWTLKVQDKNRLQRTLEFSCKSILKFAQILPLHQDLVKAFQKGQILSFPRFTAGADLTTQASTQKTWRCLLLLPILSSTTKKIRSEMMDGTSLWLGNGVYSVCGTSYCILEVVRDSNLFHDFFLNSCNGHRGGQRHLGGLQQTFLRDNFFNGVKHDYH